MRILVQRHNWAIFLRKWTRSRCCQWRSLLGHVERIFVHKKWRKGYWQHLFSTGRCYVPHSRSFTRCFAPCFWRSHYWSQSWCHLATSELRFDTIRLLLVGWRIDKCYNDKPETIDALNHNIREDVGEIQLNTIDNILKNWTDRVGYCLFSIINRNDCTFK